MKIPLFYRNSAVFGLDIGSKAIKVMQIEQKAGRGRVVCYGQTDSSHAKIDKGVITDLDATAKLIDELLSSKLVGTLTTNRAVVSIPVSRVFTRVLSLPVMKKKELESAIALEVEQSIPMPTKELYYDYEVSEGPSGDTIIRLVAAPKGIVDSYIAVCDRLGLYISTVQTNIEADAALCLRYEPLGTNQPYIVIDLGGEATDVGILDSTLRISGTVDVGGTVLTREIAKSLDVSFDMADQIKTNQGINAGDSQKQIIATVSPVLDKIVAEIKRMKKFYEERLQSKNKVAQIILFGGGANMPGLAGYMTDALRIPTRTASPWRDKIDFNELAKPERQDLVQYLTAAGLAVHKNDEGAVK